MIVHVHADDRITLEDPDTFTAFHVVAPGRDAASVAATIGGDARADEQGHVWLPIAQLHRLGEAHGGAEWRAGFDGMIAWAASKGWVEGDGTLVRAHLED